MTFAVACTQHHLDCKFPQQSETMNDNRPFLSQPFGVLLRGVVLLQGQKFLDRGDGLSARVGVRVVQAAQLPLARFIDENRRCADVTMDQAEVVGQKPNGFLRVGGIIRRMVGRTDL